MSIGRIKIVQLRTRIASHELNLKDYAKVLTITSDGVNGSSAFGTLMLEQWRERS